MTKRVFDLVASLVGMVVLAPAMAVIAVMIKRDSRGPAIFRQQRIGRGGRPFTLLKFRTMSAASNPEGPLITSATDNRVTKLGARLRATKLDELPQLLNVALGDMSIVGPRPEVAKYVDLWPEPQRRTILAVRPGITDPMTLELRREEALLANQPSPETYYIDHLLPQKVRAYAQYAETRSMVGDLRILLTTIKALLPVRSTS